MAGPESDTPGLARSELVRVLESAARLQEVLPDAVLVGGSAAALWANHRSSFDHDHVLGDLSTRFDAVLEAIEATDGWVTNRVTPGKIILGDLGDIESGVRQLIRNRPLEVTEVSLPSGHVLRVPTPDETLRIKGYLIVRRNQVRDYLDVAALADRYGIAHAADVLRHIDAYYSDQRGPGPEGVATQLARQQQTQADGHSHHRPAWPVQEPGRTLGQLGKRDRRLPLAGCGDDAMTTALKFRNVDASPDDPVETWPFEGILAAVERGTLPDWRRLAAAIRADPWGPVAQQVLEAIRLSHPYGTAELLEGVVTRARELAIDSEREEVASEVRDLVARSGLSKQDFAERIGTSRSRLSTYMSGKVVPSATLIVRMRRAAHHASEVAAHTSS
jgi:DNA-binding transcriptional regulator YiaG